jgi:hypothetical protein
MTAAFFLLMMGSLLSYAGFKNIPVGNLIQGDTTPRESSFGNDTDTAAATMADSATGASGVGTFEGKKVANWIIPELQYARAHGWKGKVSSGWRSFAEQTRIYNSGVRPAAKPGTSNHEGDEFPRGAVDVTQAAELDKILRAKPGGSPLKWAGTKDPVHFSHPHDGSY